MSSTSLLWRGYNSANGSKTGYRWLVGLEIRCKVTIKIDSFTKVVLERYKDKAKILYIEPKEEESLGCVFSNLFSRKRKKDNSCGDKF